MSDVSNQFIEMLRQLRELKFRFGFMSIDRGMEAFSRGGSEFAALTGLLDQLLAMRGAMPDFWMAWREFPQGNGTEFPHRNAVRQIPDSRMIRRAADWYEVDKEETVYVSSSATGLVAARDMDEIHVPYFDPHEPPDEAMQLDRLLLRIQQILGLGDHRTG
ncbi:hypothetical protein ACSV5S_21235 [Agrobacterium deltaense]|uniref:hypothetical protein n=1 Tax=Agrobacterium deltaense TaxID=1183412 RepID=UPI003FD0BC4A